MISNGINIRYLDAYLVEGYEAVKPKDLKNHIGKDIVFLCNSNIDKSGRGYIFPRHGSIESKYRSRIFINGSDYYVSDIVECPVKHKT